MAVQIKEEGLQKILADLTKLDQNILQLSRTALNTAGKEGLSAAQILCPVRTGYLRSTLYYKTTAGAVSSMELGGTAPYTIFQEFGTSRGIKPRKFIRGGLEISKTSLNREISRLLKI
jgi:HK97 gp10 family phage protein